VLRNIPEDRVMNLKLLALLTIVFSLLVFSLAFIFGLPVAYVPSHASLVEYTIYHMVFIVGEVGVLSYLFTHMIMKSKLEFGGDISKLID